jgi:hypothetical protein
MNLAYNRFKVYTVRSTAYTFVFVSIFAFILKPNLLLAQRPSVDSIYKKGTMGIEYRFRMGISLNHAFVRGNNLYDFTNGAGFTYFFKNRWSVALGAHHHISSSNFGLKPIQNYFFTDVRLRYHVRNWYFGTSVLYGNAPIALFDVYYEPRQKVIAFAHAGLHARTSTYKKFWKDTFIVVDFAVGPSLYTEFKPDGFSRRFHPNGNVGLHYFFNRK